MKSGIRYFLFFVLVFNVITCSGCEDPVASMVKSSQEAATKAAEIKSNEKIELEKLKSKERMAQMKYQNEQRKAELEARKAELEAMNSNDPNQVGDGLPEKSGSVNVTTDNNDLGKGEGQDK